MYLREAPTTTLADLRERVEDDGVVTQIQHSQVRLDLTADVRTITLGESTTIPIGAEGVVALGSWLDVPKPFLQRLDADVQQHLLSTLLERNPANAAFVYGDEGLREVRDPNKRIIPVRSLVDIASRVIDPTAPVVESDLGADEFRLDVIVPEGFDRGIGGDRQVGDISRAGVRIGQDRKHNLAPWVEPFQYRLLCTNGMVTEDAGLRVDARGATVEEVLAEFEQAADRAFRRVEADMQAFYDLRTQRVENPERTVIREAEERGLPARTVLRLAERIPAYAQENGLENGWTMFDVVNLITNQANDPSVARRRGARDMLVRVGGSVVSEHATRCNHCSSRLN